MPHFLSLCPTWLLYCMYNKWPHLKSTIIEPGTVHSSLLVFTKMINLHMMKLRPKEIQ